MSQGGNANINGMRLEKRIEELLNSFQLEFFKQHKYTSIYGHNAKMDFYIKPLDLALECKNQEGAGSVAEKIPYVLEAFEQHPSRNGLLILGGEYWKTKPGIKEWACTKVQKSSKKITILYEHELGEYFEQTKNRSTTKHN
jgi:hypothetical protein